MKKIYLILIILLFCIFGFPGCQGSSEKDKDTALVVVNGQKLTEEDIEFELSLVYEDSVPYRAKQDYLNRWTENELLYQEAKKRGLEDNPEIKMRAKQAVKDVVVLSFLKSQISNQIQVSEEEARGVYEQNKELFRREQDEVRASHILLSTPSQADSAYARIKKGEDFGSLAWELSLDSQSRNWGGDLGYFSLSNIHPLIARKAFELQVGRVSLPFETEMGYHILKVIDKKPKGSLRDFTEVKGRLMNQLLAEKKRGAVTSLLDELKNKAKIEKFGWARDSLSMR